MTTSTHTILIADDEPLSLRALQSILVGRGFHVRAACDGAVGWSMVDDCGEDAPHLLITDMDMPGYCGEELAQHARERYPEIKVLFTSGEPQRALLKVIATDNNARFLEKPFLQADLLAALRELEIA
jgi:two-component system cell cycle sensor histidine kinase/response regulator CckA